jgi:hypothetical protein
VAIAITPDQQASLRDSAEAVQTLLAAGGAENPFFSERTGVHVATSLSSALLGERDAQILLNQVGERVLGLSR